MAGLRRTASEQRPIHAQEDIMMSRNVISIHFQQSLAIKYAAFAVGRHACAYAHVHVCTCMHAAGRANGMVHGRRGGTGMDGLHVHGAGPAALQTAAGTSSKLFRILDSRCRPYDTGSKSGLPSCLAGATCMHPGNDAMQLPLARACLPCRQPRGIRKIRRNTASSSCCC